MQLGSTLFLAGAISFLVALQAYSAVEIESFIGANLQTIGISLLVLALVCLKYDKTIAKLANYLSLGGIAYLLLSNRDAILAIVGGLHVH